MRFFTLDVYNHWYEHFDDVLLDQVFDRYTAHLESMNGKLPDNVLALAKLSGVDDGLVIRVQHDRSAQVLCLTMRCGDMLTGYYDLALVYEGATITPEHDQVLARVARTTKSHRTFTSDVAYHEVDSSDDGRIEHRLLFHPGVWFAIQCDVLRWDRISRPDRLLPPCPDRYAGGPPATDPK